MTLEGWIAVGILLVAATLFVRKWLPVEVTALAIPVALIATGVLDYSMAPDTEDEEEEKGSDQDQARAAT